MPQVRIVTNGVSNGARALAETVGASRLNIKVKSKARLPKHNIKWGCFPLPEGVEGSWLNAQADDTSLSKLSCFQALGEAEVSIPRFTQSKEEAEGWGAKRIYERHKLRGSEGEGIVIKQAGEPLGSAPLYVEGCYGKRREYRIHVFNTGATFRTFVQQKKRRTTDVEETTSESRIRNLANGWIFAHQEIQTPRASTIDNAVRAITALGLDFGAVDVIEMSEGEASYVLEVNCAPGLQGATLFFYADAIKQALEEPTESEE